MGTREDLRTAVLKEISDVPTRLYVTPGGTEVLCKGLTMAQMDAVYTVAAANEGQAGKVGRWQVTLALEGAYDPESGERLFDKADADYLMGGGAQVVQGISTVVAQLSGFSDEQEINARARALRDNPFDEDSSS